MYAWREGYRYIIHILLHKNIPKSVFFFCQKQIFSGVKIKKKKKYYKNKKEKLKKKKKK